MNRFFDGASRRGMASGTLLTVLANIQSEDILRTAVLASIGAAVSFMMTHLLKLLFQRKRK
jgi:hypothetical protein